MLVLLKDNKPENFSSSMLEQDEKTKQPTVTLPGNFPLVKQTNRP